MWVYRGLSWITLIISYLILILIPLYSTFSLIEIGMSSNWVIIILNLLLLSIEIFGFLFAFYLFYMISGALKFRLRSTAKVIDHEFHPSFTIIIPSHGTSFSTLKKTLVGSLRIEYSNFNIIVSDNGQDSNTTRLLREFCANNHIQFFHKKDSRGFKRMLSKEWRKDRRGCSILPWSCEQRYCFTSQRSLGMWRCG